MTYDIKPFVALLLTIMISQGCASYSQMMVGANGVIYKCGSYGQGLFGVAHAKQINEDCIRTMKAAGYLEIEQAGVIGIVFEEQTPQDTVVRILRVVEGSPAKAAGVQAGEVLLSVDGYPVRRSTNAGNLLFGRAGTTVTITCMRDTEEIKVPLVRRSYVSVYGSPNQYGKR